MTTITSIIDSTTAISSRSVLVVQFTRLLLVLGPNPLWLALGLRLRRLLRLLISDAAKAGAAQLVPSFHNGRPAQVASEAGRASGADPHPLSLRTGATLKPIFHLLWATESSHRSPRVYSRWD